MLHVFLILYKKSFTQLGLWTRVIANYKNGVWFVVACLGGDPTGKLS